MRKLNMGEMRTQVGANVGIIDDSTYNTKILAWMNQVYEDVWDEFFWPGSLLRGSTNTTAAQDFLNFPPSVRRVLMLSQGSTPAWLRFSDTQDFVRQFYADLTTQGTPTDWAEDGEHMVLAQPSSASTLSLTSASASDLSQTVRVIGRDANGILLSESMSINGTSAVVSANTYTTIEQIAKSATSVGIFTLTSNSAAVTVARIAPSELSMAIQRARLFLVPDAAIAMKWIAKKHPVRLVNPEDQLMARIENPVISGTTARAMREQGDPRAVEWEATTGNQISGIIDEILGTGMRTLKLVPDFTRKPRSNFRGDYRTVNW